MASWVCSASSLVGATIESPDAPAFALHQAIEDRQDKGRGLAGAGMGQAHDVVPLHDQGDCLGLDRGWGEIACRDNAGGDLGVKIKCVKFHKSFFSPFGKKSPVSPEIFNNFLPRRH